MHEHLQLNKDSWEKAAPRFFGRAALPEYGPLAPLETELALFDHIDGRAVLDIGCGSGHSLQYMARNGAREMWGLDLSAKQIEAAQSVLANESGSVHLFESPMECDPGLPANYFDIAYSIYAIGWTVDLQATVEHIYRYLRPGGSFIFSWEHPMHDRIQYTEHGYMLTKSYIAEGPELNEAWHQEVITYQRTMSSYINTFIAAGFTIEKLIEDVKLPEVRAENDPQKWYSATKAALTPATFIIKARK